MHAFELSAGSWYRPLMVRPRKADRGSIVDETVSIRLTKAGLAAVDAAVARTAATAESRGIHVTRSEFMIAAVFRAVRATGVVIEEPIARLLDLPGEVATTQPTLPGVDGDLFQVKRQR